jgi:hypothetical protein
MLKRSILLFILLAVLLAACGGATPSAQISEEATAAGESEAAPSEAIPGKIDTSAGVAGSASTTLMADCQVSPSRTQPDPTMQAIFGAPNEQDWIKGAETAFVTITEYSDFQ